MTLERHERAGTCDTPEDAAAMRAFLERYHARRLPWSADMDSSLASNGIALELYRKLGGGPCDSPNETTPFDMTTHLPRITLPTLFVAGEYDYASPETLQLYRRLVPGSRLVSIPNSGHITMHDQPAREIRALRDFLRRVERR